MQKVFGLEETSVNDRPQHRLLLSSYELLTAFCCWRSP